MYWLLLIFIMAGSNVSSTTIVANVGENISLTCNPDRFTSDLYWTKDNQYFAAVDTNYPNGGIYKDYKDSRLSQSYKVTNETMTRSFAIYIYDTRVTDTATYTCVQTGLPPYREEYDVYVLECSNCLIDPSSRDPRYVDITCHLKNYNTSHPVLINTTLNGMIQRTAIISDNNLTFSVSIDIIYNDIEFMFNPFNGTSSYINCLVPAKKSTTTSLNTVLTLLNTATTVSSSEIPNGKFKAKILIVVIISFLFLVILAIVIFILRKKLMNNMKPKRISSIETNDSTDETFGPCYESIDRVQHMEENNDPELTPKNETVIYTLPNKSGIIKRYTKSTILNPSPGNLDDTSVTITSRRCRGTDHEIRPMKINQYEDIDLLGPKVADNDMWNFDPESLLDMHRNDVEIYAISHNTGLGSNVKDGEDYDQEVPSYAMPDKGLRSPVPFYAVVEQRSNMKEENHFPKSPDAEVACYALPEIVQ